MEATVKDKMNVIKIIYNNDVAVIDFLADLKNRGPIQGLQKFINWSTQGPHCLLYNCLEDNLVVLILYKAPVELNERSNNLILYAYDDLDGLRRYFKKWVDNISEDNKVLYKALNDILRLLYLQWAQLQDDNIQKDFLEV